MCSRVTGYVNAEINHPNRVVGISKISSTKRGIVRNGSIGSFKVLKVLDVPESGQLWFEPF